MEKGPNIRQILWAIKYPTLDHESAFGVSRLEQKAQVTKSTLLPLQHFNHADLSFFSISLWWLGGKIKMIKVSGQNLSGDTEKVCSRSAERRTSLPQPQPPQCKATRPPHSLASPLVKNKPHGNDNNNKQKQRRDRKWLRLNSITRLIREGRVTKEPSVSASSSSSVRLTSCHAKWVHFDWTYALGHCGRGAGGAARFVQMELGQLHRQGST